MSNHKDPFGHLDGDEKKAVISGYFAMFGKPNGQNPGVSVIPQDSREARLERGGETSKTEEFYRLPALDEVT